MDSTDYLIVGHGLAGSVLAWTFREKGMDFRIVDRDEGAFCSQAAGGLINPISPRRPTKGWRAEIHFPYAERFYRWVGDRTERPFYHPLPIHRPFSDEEEKERWSSNAKKKGYDRFLYPKSPQKLSGIDINPRLGAATFQGAYLDLPAFLEKSSEKAVQEGSLFRRSFDPQELNKMQHGWEWEGIRFKKLILCQGTRIRECPFFGHLPLRPNKGEILTLKMPDFPEDLILNRNFYAIPLGEGKVRIGATYDHQDLTPEATRAKKEELLDRMEQWVHSPYEVLDHRVGFRPTTPDTRPYVGFHHEEKNVAVFNGLGSKGIVLAPYWAQKLTEKLQEGVEEAPDPEVEPERFDKNRKAAKA